MGNPGNDRPELSAPPEREGNDNDTLSMEQLLEQVLAQAAQAEQAV